MANDVYGIVSNRKNGSYGIICGQCHHLIINDGVEEFDKLVFTCDRCESKNKVAFENMKNAMQNKEWKDLWKTPQEKQLIFDKYGNPIREAK